MQGKINSIITFKKANSEQAFKLKSFYLQNGEKRL